MGIVLDEGVIALYQAPMRFYEAVSAFSKIVARGRSFKPARLREVTAHNGLFTRTPDRRDPRDFGAIWVPIWDGAMRSWL
jgi:hypothetical protein